jgi:probable DNA repair protein
MTADARAYEHLEAGGLLIVETRESARAVRHAHDRRQRLAARTVWPSARVLTLDDWLAELWQEARTATRDPRILLADSQVARALAAIIEAESAVPLLNVDATARTAMRSWRRVHDWGIDLERLEVVTEEERGFKAWVRRLRHQQLDEGWIDRAQLGALVAAGPPKSISRERIALVGFEERAPIIERLLRAFVDCGASAELLPAPVIPSHASRFAAVDPAQELIAAASWARAWIERDAGATLAIIVPDLAQRRAEVRATLDRIIDPANGSPAQAARLPLYSIVGGEPLASHAVVDAGLTLLRFGDPSIAWTDAGRLLRAPYLRGFTTESGARARLDRLLRKLGRVDFKTAELLRRARESGCADWADACERASLELGDRRQRLRAGAWAGRFGAALRAGGWPDGRPLTSPEHQAAGRLRELLAEFAGLESLLPAMDLQAARTELRRLCHEAGFQPESGDPPIRVLDAIEHPGPNYDGLWVSGLTAERWPRAAEPDPFLPIGLQRALAMPWATAARELERARRATGRLLGAARELILSSPRQIEESLCEPSPLIPADLEELPAIDSEPTYATRIHAARQLESIDDAGPALTIVGDTLRGGARRAELQAKCPFQAFGEFRLQAVRLESARPGISPRLRGQLVHRMFEHLWRELGSQERLRALSRMKTELEGRIEAAAAAACADLAAGAPPRLIELERSWLVKVAAAVLEKENERAPFRVLQLETTTRFTLGEVTLLLKIDRIDELEAAAGGGEFIIDYKTGRETAARWFGARRDLPQLPLYALSRAAPVAGLAFARANLRAPGFRGLATNATAGQGIREPRRPREFQPEAGGFPAILADWRRWLTGLIGDHLAGVARVDPVSSQTCRECALAALCRIGADLPADEESDDGD